MEGGFDTCKKPRVRHIRMCSERIKLWIAEISTHLLVALCAELGGHEALLGFESVPLDHVENVASSIFGLEESCVRRDKVSLWTVVMTMVVGGNLGDR